MNLDPFRLLFSVLLVCVWFQTQQVSLVSRLLFVWVFLGVLPAVLLCKLEDPVVQLGLEKVWGAVLQATSPVWISYRGPVVFTVSVMSLPVQ